MSGHPDGRATVAVPDHLGTSLLIDGDLVTGAGTPVESWVPGTGTLHSRFPGADEAQVTQAVRAARTAFDRGTWAKLDGEQRAAHLASLGDAVAEYADVFVELMVSEVGSPIGIARALQVDSAIAHLHEFARLAPRSHTLDLGPHPGPPASRSEVRFQPAGVVAAISAYNYPLLLSVVKVGAALAAGCSVVLLVSERAPRTGLLIGELAHRAGIPDGVLNVLTGDGRAGAVLTSSPLIDRVSFTGSLEVGRRVLAQSADAVAGAVLELGGKSANILLPSAVLDEQSVSRMHKRYMRNAGQGCASPTRILVPWDRFDDFVDLSRAAYAATPVGDPWREETVVGPVIRPEHRDRIEGFLDRATADGAEILAGGGRPDLAEGWFVNPALVRPSTASREIVDEEVFGPVAVVLPYRDVAEAVDIANANRYGLAAYVEAAEPEEARALADRLHAGTVYVNGGGALRPDAPFGGWKASGVGREWGEWGVREYLEPQHVQWPVA